MEEGTEKAATDVPKWGRFLRALRILAKGERIGENSAERCWQRQRRRIYIKRWNKNKGNPVRFAAFPFRKT
jgi:hypothetical protein